MLTYVAFVIRVGGDFMFGRFMIPLTPVLLVLFEQGIARVALCHRSDRSRDRQVAGAQLRKRLSELKRGSKPEF